MLGLSQEGSTHHQCIHSPRSHLLLTCKIVIVVAIDDIIGIRWHRYGCLALLLLIMINIPWVEQSTSVSFDDALIAALENWDTVESS